jgi:hypothetical protein
MLNAGATSADEHELDLSSLRMYWPKSSSSSAHTCSSSQGGELFMVAWAKESHINNPIVRRKLGLPVNVTVCGTKRNRVTQKTSKKKKQKTK